MKQEIITNIKVKDSEIRVMRVNNEEYISLTDLARYQNSTDPSFTVKNWLRKVTTINFLGLWEQLNNGIFNLVEFDQIKIEYGKNSFAISPSQWIRRTNSIGIISKAGKYSSGTFAHPDIAFEFASWLSPEFKLYLIQEFQRLKKNECYQQQVEWQANRTLAKVNYLVHTNAISEYIVPTLTDKQIRYVYAEEADVLNVALFGMTAKEWRDKNPELSQTGNIRDNTDLLHLIILNNLENINAELIEMNIKQSERLIKLNNIAKKQINIIKNNKLLNNLKYIERIKKNSNNTYNKKEY